MTELTKAAKQRRCRSILCKGEGVVSDDDFQWLMTHVFPAHPDWPEKQGAGVSGIRVGRHDRFQSVGFFIERADGSVIDISYKVSLFGRGTVWAQLCDAARAEVKPQISAWRAANPPARHGLQVDHANPSFDALFRAWLDVTLLRPEDIAINSQRVGFVSLFHERALATSWQRFHQQRATYQWLTQEQNLHKGNRAAEDEPLFEVPF